MATTPETQSAQAVDPSRRDLADRLLFLRYDATRDPADRDAIVRRYMPLARRLASRYGRGDEPFDDIFQIACLGLVKAVERFDRHRGIPFSSYAVPTITGEIKRHFRDRTWSVRVPRDLQDLALRVDGAVADMTRELGRQPSVEAIARALDTSEENVLEALQAASARRTTSLDAPAPTADEEAGGTLGEAVGLAEDGYERAEQRATLGALLQHLTAREREVLRLRFEEDLTQHEIGRRVGLSQMQISRILRHAMERVRAVARVDLAPEGDGGSRP
jgi:RNA polymerase sigma-B factor